MRRVLSLKLAYRHVRASVGRMALTIVAVALGVALVVAVRLMNEAVLAAFLDTVDGVVGRASLTISAGEGLTFDEALVDRIAEVPGVAIAVPLVRGVAFPDDGSGELLTVHGVDVTNDAAVRLYHRTDRPDEVVADELEFLSQPDSIIVGREFAEGRGLGLDSRLDLVTPTGVRRFTIRGLLDSQGLAKTLGGRLVVMDVYAAQRMFTRDGQINQVDVVVEPSHDAGAVKTRIAAIVPPGLSVEEPVMRKELIRRTVRGFQGIILAFGLLAVLAGFVICYSRLGAIFEARMWEVGLFRAVGLSRKTVFTELLKESLLLGIAGTVAGIPLGVAIGRLALPAVARATALNFRMPVPVSSATWDWSLVRDAASVGLGAAVLAACLPAFTLARTEPVAALRMRGRPASAPSAFRVRSIVAAVLTLAAVVLVLAQWVTDAAALGNVTTPLLAAACWACANPLVVVGGRWLGTVWQSLFGATGRTAARHLAEHASRASLTAATLGMGLGAVVMFGMLAWSFEQTLVSVLTARMRADLVLSSAFLSGGYVGAPLTSALLPELGAIQGVAVVAGEQQRDVEYEGGTVVLDAYDPVCFRDIRVCAWHLEPGQSAAALDAVADGRGALVSTSFARLHGVQPPAEIEMSSPTGPRRLRVVGVTNGQPASAIIVSRDLYREAWQDISLSWIHVATDPGEEPAAVAARIGQQLGPRYRLRTRSRAAIVEYFAAQARQAFAILYVMEAVTFALVLVAIGDTLATGVLERTREFGMLRAVGIRRSRLFGLVLLEGLAIGVFGLVLALGAGLALGWLWVGVQFPALVGWSLQLHVPATSVAAAVALTLVLCLVGALLPARRASRLSVVSALRYE